MADNTGAVPFSSPDEGIDFPTKAKLLVEEEIKSSLNEDGIRPSDIYVVWFAYALGTWKALVSTSKRDGRYYEVTHNKAKNETYVDTYMKISNTVITGEVEN